MAIITRFPGTEASILGSCGDCRVHEPERNWRIVRDSHHLGYYVEYRMTEEKRLYTWQLETGAQEAYEQYIVPVWMAEWAQVLIEAGNISPGKRVLDVACGSGIVARKAAALVGSGGRVAGLDANEGMLQVAGRSAFQEGKPGIEWYRADVSRMPFSPGEFDIVFCQQGLQFFPDKKAALQEMARVLAPGGRLVLSTWGGLDRFPFLAIILDVVGRYCKPGTADTFRASCSFAGREALRSLLQDAGFCNIHLRMEVRVSRYPSVAEFLPAYLLVTPFAAEIALMQEQERARIFDEVITALDTYMDDDGLAIPAENHIATAEPVGHDIP